MNTRRIGVALTALLSHWRRRPGQLLTFVIGLALATGLWTGVQAINIEARTSYSRAEATISPDGLDSIALRAGGAMTVADFVALQRKGWKTSPVLEGQIENAGRSLRVVGIEPLTAPGSLTGGQVSTGEGDPLAFIRGQGLAIVSPSTAAALADAEGLPPRRAVEGSVDDTLVVDIGVAERLLRRPGQVDRLLVLAEQPLGQRTLPGRFVRRTSSAAQDVSSLTDSFHLNLTAFGLLSFAVGLFIVHATVGLAFEQRRGLFRTLRTMGLSTAELVAAVGLELLFFAVVAGASGVALGYAVAAALLPDVAATLRGLYGADVSGTLAFRAQWWATGLAVALIGTAVAAGGSVWRLTRLPILAAAQPRAWALQSGRVTRMQALVAFLLLATAGALLAFGTGLVVGFIVLGLLLVGSALLLPLLFSAALTLGERGARGALSQWFWADTRQQVPGLSLALMALLLALAANIGVSTMVGSFRDTFTGWLDQRLAAELYVRADDDAQRGELLTFLGGKVDAVLPLWSVEARLANRPGEIFAMADHATYRDHWPMLDASPDVWRDLATGKAILVNEQLARGEGLVIGDALTLPGWTDARIAGVYSDYGNPKPQAIVGDVRLAQLFPDAPQLRFALRLPEDRVDALAGELRTRFGFAEDALIDQRRIKAFSLDVFERTFTVTDALNILTLAVAGFAIFTSLLTLATMRLPQLAPLWALGLTRRRLAGLDLLRAALLAMLTVIVALPVGLALAWLLLSVVNVEAFGWKLPMTLFPWDWLRLGLFAVAAALLAAAVPAWRLARIEPAELVRVFTHER
ncbi:ABC transporter permease [Rhizobiaceae bacterium]|nr:ABC transporter permease [Rhizobiaceae bacterium]